MAAPTCREIEAQLSLLADGTLPPDEAALVRSHVAQCASCRGLLADIEQLRRVARQVGPITPPDHIWLELAGQIRRAGPAPAAPPPPARAPVWQWAGLAAALIIITGVLYTVQRTVPGDAGPPSGSAAPTGSVDTVADELNLAAAHYEKAIAELEALARSGDSPLEAEVSDVVRDNLGAIDLAISESRAALASNPQSEPARDSLFEALKRKVSVLQLTVSLINEMRSGDQEGAQRAAESLGKKS